MRFVEGVELKYKMSFSARIGFVVEYRRCHCLHFDLVQEALRSRVAGHLLELMEQKAMVLGFGEGFGNGLQKKVDPK